MLPKVAMSVTRKMLREAAGTPEYAALVQKLESSGAIDREAIARRLNDPNVTLKNRFGYYDITQGNRGVPQAGGLRGLKDKLTALQSHYNPVSATINAPQKGTLIPHELYEAVVAAKTGRTPQEVISRYDALADTHMRKIVDKTVPILEKGKSAIDYIKGYRQFTHEKGPKFFSHYSPEVIIREAHMLPLLPEKEQNLYKAMRNGLEAEALSRIGIDYNKPPVKLTREVFQQGAKAPDLLRSTNPIERVKTLGRSFLNLPNVIKHL